MVDGAQSLNRIVVAVIVEYVWEKRRERWVDG